MNEHITSLVNKYRTRGLLLDTVLFVLLVVGGQDRKSVGRDKRLSQYAPEDLETLVGFLQLFSKIVTTPNVITEVSNLTGHLLGTAFPNEFLRHLVSMDERYVPSATLGQSDLFSRVGITDAAIAHVSRGEFLVLTDDLRLVGHLEKRNIDVLNFNHVRVFNWK